MSYRRTHRLVRRPRGALGGMFDVLFPAATKEAEKTTSTPLFSTKTQTQIQRTNEIVEDRSMAAERGGVVVPGPLTADQLPSALVLKARTLGLDSPLKLAATVGVIGLVGYMAWRSAR